MNRSTSEIRVSGNGTYDARADLKACGFVFDNQMKAWVKMGGATMSERARISSLLYRLKKNGAKVLGFND